MLDARIRSLVMVLAVLAVLAGAGLRFTNLAGKVFWHDEAHTALRVSGYTTREFLDTAFVNRIYARDELLNFQHPTADRDWGDTLAALMSRPEHAPLYYLLVRAAFAFTDDARLATRSVAALISLLLLPAALWLWRELFGGQRAEGLGAWLLLGLLAVSPFQLVYAQEGRQYSLWAVMVLTVCAALLRARRRNDPPAWIGYAVLVTIGLYSHLMLTMVLAAQLLWMLWVARAQFQPFVLALSAALLMFAPWMLLFFEGSDDIAVVTAWMKAAVPVGQLSGAWLAHLTHQFVDRGELLYGNALVLPLIAFGVYGTARHAPAQAGRLLFVLLLCTAGMVIGPDLIPGGRRSQEARYLLPAMLVLMFMLAYALGHAADSARVGVRAAALALWTGLLGIGLWSDVNYVRAESWWNKSMSRANHEVGRIIDTAARPLVITTDGETNPGELLSVAHEVAANTRFMPVDRDHPPDPRTLDGDVFLITPSPRLLAHFAAHGALTELHQGGRLWSFKPGRHLSQSSAPPSGEIR